MEGWMIPVENGVVEQWTVKAGAIELPGVEAEVGIPSPDVRKAWPNLNGADRARFTLRAPCTLGAVRDTLLAITPVLKQGRGDVMFGLVEPSLPLPDESFAKSVGEGFLGVSLEFLGYLVERAGLEPGDRVLDAGCGLGRMAYGLSYYLDDTAVYEGFDVSADLISWAKTNIGSRRPNFRFQRVDVANRTYNPRGRVRAEEFTFPYPAEEFDIVLLASVFTHLTPPHVRTYLRQISRVLRPSGRCLASCFLMTDEVRSRIISGHSTQNLVHEVEDCYTSNRRRPEDAIGHDPDLLWSLAAESGLKVRDIYHGLWYGGSRPGSYQDILILEKA